LIFSNSSRAAVYQTYDDASPGFNPFGGGSSEVSTGTQEIASFEKYQFTRVSALAPLLNDARTVYTSTGTSFTAPGVIASLGLDAGSSLTVAVQ
jgi:hypothetical protein